MGRGAARTTKAEKGKPRARLGTERRDESHVHNRNGNHELRGSRRSQVCGDTTLLKQEDTGQVARGTSRNIPQCQPMPRLTGVSRFEATANLDPIPGRSQPHGAIERLAGAADTLVMAIVLALNFASGQRVFCRRVPSRLGLQTVVLCVVVLDQLADCYLGCVTLLLQLEQ